VAFFILLFNQAAAAAAAKRFAWQVEPGATFYSSKN
jgi:hypothetical protein